MLRCQSIRMFFAECSLFYSHYMFEEIHCALNLAVCLIGSCELMLGCQSIGMLFTQFSLFHRNHVLE
jgi:hypothetical protein